VNVQGKKKAGKGVPRIHAGLLNKISCIQQKCISLVRIIQVSREQTMQVTQLMHSLRLTSANN